MTKMIGVFSFTPIDDEDTYDAKLTAQQRVVARIIHRKSNSRLDSFGGYPDEFAFIGDLVAVATVDDKDAPSLEIMELKDFIEENECFLEEI